MAHIGCNNKPLEKTVKTGKFTFIRKNITDYVKIMVTVAPYMEYPGFSASSLTENCNNFMLRDYSYHFIQIPKQQTTIATTGRNTR